LTRTIIKLDNFFYNKFYYELEKNIYKCSKLFTININMEKKLIQVKNDLNR